MLQRKFLINYGGRNDNRMKFKKVSKCMLKICEFIKKFIEDILILGGLTVIVIATFLLSKIAGLYCLGVVLLGVGIYFSINPPERR